MKLGKLKYVGISGLLLSSVMYGLLFPFGAEAATNTTYNNDWSLYQGVPFIIPADNTLNVTDSLNTADNEVYVTSVDNSILGPNYYGLPFNATVAAGVVDYYDGNTLIYTDDPTTPGSYIIPPGDKVSGNTDNNKYIFGPISGSDAIGHGEVYAQEAFPGAWDNTVQVNF